MIESVFKAFIKIFGSRNERLLKKIRGTVAEINALESKMAALSDADLPARTRDLKKRVRDGAKLEDVLPEAFALVRESSRRTPPPDLSVLPIDPILPNKVVLDGWSSSKYPGLRHYDVQFIGGVVLHTCGIAEMATGEGKTLVATAPAFLNALAERGVHVVTVNDYLARRDAAWMAPIFQRLGLTVGLIQSEMTNAQRKVAYACDITYGTNNEYGFDYLRDNMKSRLEDQVQTLYRGCLDMMAAYSEDVAARLPGFTEQRLNEHLAAAMQILPLDFRHLAPDDPRRDRLKAFVEVLAPAMKTCMTKLLSMEIERDAERRADPNAAARQTRHEFVVRRSYAIVDEVDNILIDEARTPLIISGQGEGDIQKYYHADEVVRKLTKGEHFEVKEKESQCILTEEGIIRAQEIVGVESFYTGNYMQWPHLLEQGLRAHHLFHRDVDYVVEVGESGKDEIIIVDEFTGRLMAGRRWSDGLHQAVEAKERLQIRAESQTLATITFQNFFKLYTKLAGMTGTAMTEAGEFLKIYNLDVVAIPTNRPCIRKDVDDRIYADQNDKYVAIVNEIVEVHGKGRPILVGTTSIEKSEKLSTLLQRKGIEHKVLNAKQHAREAEIVAMAGQEGAVTIATNMAGRGTDIKLGPGIAERGGLHVLGTERHEARRIDNQLRGRCARQGDPGSSAFFLALDDDLMRRFASDNVAAMLKKLGLKDGQAIEHPWINKSVANAQKKVEERNFDIRKNLLEYDNVMNEQRGLIYGDRHRILEGRDLSEMVMRMFEEVIDIATPRELGSEAAHAEWQWDALEGWFQRKTGEPIKLDRNIHDLEKIKDRLEEGVREVYKHRIEAIGPELMASIERYILLNSFDTRWKDHLANMDALKSGIGLRGYAQVDPKVEYKREAYEMFEELIRSIQDEVTDLVLRMRLSEEEAKQTKNVWKVQETKHEQIGQYEQTRKQQDAAVAQNQSKEPAKPFVRTDAKVGRNDPCPCGSGRKYKKCCGANDPSV